MLADHVRPARPLAHGDPLPGEIDEFGYAQTGLQQQHDNRVGTGPIASPARRGTSLSAS